MTLQLWVAIPLHRSTTRSPTDAAPGGVSGLSTSHMEAEPSPCTTAWRTGLSCDGQPLDDGMRVRYSPGDSLAGHPGPVPGEGRTTWPGFACLPTFSRPLPPHALPMTWRRAEPAWSARLRRAVSHR
jgi:hypothetical protein